MESISIAVHVTKESRCKGLCSMVKAMTRMLDHHGHDYQVIIFTSLDMSLFKSIGTYRKEFTLDQDESKEEYYTKGKAFVFDDHDLTCENIMLRSQAISMCSYVSVIDEDHYYLPETFSDAMLYLEMDPDLTDLKIKDLFIGHNVYSNKKVQFKELCLSRTYVYDIPESKFLERVLRKCLVPNRVCLFLEEFGSDYLILDIPDLEDLPVQEDLNRDYGLIDPSNINVFEDNEYLE